MQKKTFDDDRYGRYEDRFFENALNPKIKEEKPVEEKKGRVTRD